VARGEGRLSNRGVDDSGARASRATWLAAPSTLLLVVMVAAPIVSLAYFSLIGEGGGLGLSNFQEMVESPLYIGLYWRSLRTATVASALATVVAWPAGWAISRAPERRKPLLLSLVVLPYLTSYLLLVYAMFVLLAANGPVMGLLGKLGIGDPSTSLLFTPKATVLMLAYEHLPIMILVLYVASERIDEATVAAARSLGAGRVQRFRRVILPMSSPSLLAGFILVFVPCAGSFVEAQILGGPNGLLVGNIISDSVTRINDAPFGSALSLVLLATVLVIVGSLTLFDRLRATSNLSSPAT
jgi:spermidine/putrescine transport system permease protein